MTLLELSDRGEACFICHVETKLLHTTGLEGLPLYECPQCGAHSFDPLTTPTDDPWTVTP